MKSNSQKPESSKVLASKLPKQLIWTFIIFALGVSLAGYYTYLLQRRQVYRAAESELAAIADLKIREITQWRKERLADAHYNSIRPLLNMTLDEFLDIRSNSTKILIDSSFHLIKETYGYQDVILIDLNQQILITIDPLFKELETNSKDLVAKTIASHQPTLGQFFECSFCNKIHLDAAAPILDTRKKPVAVLILRSNPEDYLFPLIQTWPKPSKSGETFIIRQEDDSVVYLNELRYRKETTLKFKLPLSSPELPAAYAILHGAGIIQGLDYRGAPVLAVTRAIPETDWFMVSKVDLAEIHNPLHRRTYFIALMTLVMIVGAGFAIMLIYRQQQAAAYRRELDSEHRRLSLLERFELLTKQANDIILLFDANERIVEANERAEQTYGYSINELLSLTASDLRAPEVRTEVSEIMKQLQYQNGVRFETYHIRKDGSVFPVEASARVIKINGDTYYQSIVRDITERKTAEQRLHKVNRALHILSDSNQAIIRARDENHLLKIICDIIIDKGGYRMCWMGYIDAKNNRVNPIMSAGYDEGYTDFLDIDLADPVRSKGPTGRAVKSAKPVFTLDMAADPTYLPWREEAMKRGYRSSIALPLIKGGAVFGTLNIYAEAPNAFDEQEVVLLSELADDLSYGIWALRSENARVTAETERDRLWDYSLDMFCIVSFDGKIKELNPAWERNTGWSSGELMQVVWIDLIHPDDRSAAREKLQRLTENESLDGFEFRLHCKNGAYRWLSVNASPLIDEKLIFAVVRDVTENKIDKENLIAKVTIENILARMSKRFITLEDLDKSIDAGLAEIGCFCKAGRAYLFQFTPDGLMMNNTHEWCAPDVSPEIENLQNLPCSMFPWWMERLEAGEVINVENVADMPPEAEAEKAILEAQSIKSVLVFPLLLENKLAGFVGFDAVTAMRSWRDDELVLLCMLSDILGTAIERRRIEDKLHESEIKFKYVFEASNVGMSLTLPTGEVQANRAYAEMLGYTQDELTGRKWQEITPPDEIATIEKIIEPLLTGERNAVRFNKRYIHKDGHYVWTDVSATMRRDTQGKPLHFIVTIVNISEKKRAEDELRESEERFRSLYENATIGLYRTTPDGKVILANPAFLKMVGYNDFDEIARRAVENRGYVNAADADKFVKLMEMYGEVNDFETAWQRKDGSTVYVRESARLARDKDGNPLYYEGTVEDITTRKMLEEQFRQAQKMEVVGRLAGGVAHDFNNLLTIITSQTELAQMSLSPDDPIYKELEEILKAAMRAAALTRQLLIFSRRETVAPQVLNINGIIANISKMLKRLLGETIELLPMLAGELWRIKADPGLMEQVVVNLSVNARDAMPQGGKLTIETDNVVLDEAFCSRFPDVKSGEYVLLSISDTGVGMSAEVREKMFEPFFTTKAVGQGTGLGLATVYGIIKQMGGFFDVASELGKGTTIKIYIPRLPAEESIETARIIESDVMPRGTEMILVVEDEDQVREMMAAVLKRLGYKVITAANGGEAWLLSWKMEYEPDLLLTDVIMPHMNGPELAGMIKTLMPKLKVLYTSGYTADVLNKQEMLNIGWNFIQKPFRPAVLAQKVREVLDG